MTTLGKILAFINLVFALLTGAFILMVFVTRTNWKAEYDLLQSRYKASHEQARTYLKEKEDLRNDKDNEIQKLRADLTQATKERDDSRRERDDNRDKLQAELDRVKSSNNTNVASTAELDRRREEVKQLQMVVADREQKINDLVKERDGFQSKLVERELALKSSEDRNQNLLTQLEELSRKLEKAQAGTAVTALPGGPQATSLRNPPPDDVKGTIKAVDPESGMVTISVGSDAGISKGNTLEVYRLKPKPLYLGTIRILDVRSHESVGKPITPMRHGVMRENDEVASSILGSR